MRVVYVIGGIASGKSSVTRLIEKKGAVRIDLDEVSRDVLAPESSLVRRVAAVFGEDLVDETSGILDRPALAQRAFSDPEKTAQLEALELPAIRAEFKRRIDALRAQRPEPVCCVVEVPLPDRMGPLLGMADEILEVSCPYAQRRARARLRGMDVGDFDRRAQRQLSDGGLSALADERIDNTGTQQELEAQVDAWWDKQGLSGAGTAEEGSEKS